MRHLVDEIQPSRNGISHSSPIKIDREGAITYKVVQDYMTSKTNVAYVENDILEEHLIPIRGERIITPGMVESNGNMKCIFHQSSCQYVGIISAINHIYILERVQMPERMKIELSKFIMGKEITLIAEKYMLGLKISKGKNPQVSRHMSSL